MENVGGIHQKPLDRLGLGFPIGIAVIDGSRPLVTPGTVGEADIVELDLVKAHQFHRLHRQIHLVLPGFPAVGRGPVGPGEPQGLPIQIRDGVFRVILHEAGVVKGGDAPDDVVAGILQLLDGGVVFFHGVEGCRGPGGAVGMHHIGGVANGTAVHDVHNKGVDAAVIGDLKIGIHLPQTPAGEVQGAAFGRHFVSFQDALFPGIVVQVGSATAAVLVFPGRVDGVASIMIVVGSSGFFAVGQIPWVDITFLVTDGDPVHVHRAILAQIVIARNLGGYALVRKGGQQPAVRIS